MAITETPVPASLARFRRLVGNIVSKPFPGRDFSKEDSSGYTTNEPMKPPVHLPEQYKQP